eukprot:CAMPEP_0168554842 /NCGR_PEP_ID=MMETSP0413-20121227/8004_1 /TAXON_ID=136452 /ORGANISM="Filamoeba nolandi, Strain NC-AS-23-1" /LENGTH=146 /DNA_ID=CAMNT_0008585627 /DNA_START=80 /DNA_END=520 /DNA_ORIENTATION=-
MVLLELPSEYGYVIISGIATFITLQYLGFQVGSSRKRLGVPLPYLYADMTAAQADKKKELFNCYQRGHQNALETYPAVLMFLFVGGIKHPLIAAIGGAIWSAGRISYAWGYQSGDPEKRMRGGFQYIGLLMMLGSTISLAVSLLNA